MGKFLKGGTISVSWGKSGGFYVRSSSAASRLCLWRVAVTYLPYDFDDLLKLAADGVGETEPFFNHVVREAEGKLKKRAL